jgi:hypothetical protein
MIFAEVNNEFRILMLIRKGNRPHRPSNDICLSHGLDDALWTLIESCWAMEPAARPSASKIVEHLSPATNASVQQRPPSDWDESFVRRNVPGIAIKVLRVYLAGNMENPLHFELKKGNKLLFGSANYVYVCSLIGLLWLVSIFIR